MADEALTLTPEDIDSFMRYRSEQGGTVDSNKAYLRAMRHFYKDLQELGGRIEAGTLGLWRDLQLDRGYSPNTISAEISVVNSYLKYIGRRDLQLEPGLQLRKRERPPLTREEYLYLLRAAREQGKERVYLLIKLFAQTGIAVQDLPLVTAEAVEDGEIVRGQAGESPVKIPPALRAELRSYGNRRGVFSGSIFVNRNGEPVSRTNVSDSIRMFCREVGVPESKGNPRSLRELYQATQDGIRARLEELTVKTYEQLLETEQMTTAWLPPSPAANTKAQGRTRK